jgi:hypothetical protein
VTSPSRWRTTAPWVSGASGRPARSPNLQIPRHAPAILSVTSRTEIAALFDTLLETAKLVGIDPANYLREAALADARGEVLLADAAA